MKDEYRSRVYTDRPDYADFDAPAKFVAIESIIAKRLKEHPNAICSYSGGADSDIMIDLIERTRKIFNLPPVKYVFFNTGLEMKATKDHVKATAAKYGVEIEEHRPKVNIVQATRKFGIPIMSKIFSDRIEIAQKKHIPYSVLDEYKAAEDKAAKMRELKERYPKSASALYYICGCDSTGLPCSNSHSQLILENTKYMKDFLTMYPPDFHISAKCCDYCKKQLAHRVQKGYDMIITGERKAEGGRRSVAQNLQSCFIEQANGQFRLKPLYWVSKADKAWYKEYYGIRYSDAYEVYGLTRTGCCGCPISYKAVDDLERIRPYEPNVVKAAWNIFGKSYLYRQKYNEYKEARKKAGQAEKGGE